ncbi:MAG: YbaN family protein [Pseudomonadota bacterium]
MGVTALALGIIGIPLPLLPTTPFILLAAFAFARSSTRLHDWLVQHQTFGPLIANWREYGAISRRAKWVSLASMVAVFGLSLALKVPTHALVIQAVVLSASAVFVMSRPLPPEARA